MDHLIIAEVGRPPGSLYTKYGGYGPMMMKMFRAVHADFSYDIISVLDGHTLPSPQGNQGLLITGSPAAAYEDHPWIAPLEDSIREWTRQNHPVVGICFGHQIMAQALGGVVQKSDRGWGVGLHTYDMAATAPSWMTRSPQDQAQQFSCAVSHKDQVVRLPPAAQRIAGSDFCPNGVIAYEKVLALSFQMHPEFETDFALDLMAARKESIPQEVREMGEASYQKPSDRLRIAEWMKIFFDRHAA